MFGMKKAVEQKSNLPVPFINPEELDNALERFEPLHGNIESKVTPKDTQELLDCIPIAEEKGLDNQVKLLKRRAIASFLEERKMALIVCDERFRLHGDDFYKMWRYNVDGVRTCINSETRRNSHQMTPLKEFGWALPTQVIKEMPSEIINSAKVLWESGDPVVFIQITPERDGKWWGIAIYQW